MTSTFVKPQPTGTTVVEVPSGASWWLSDLWEMTLRNIRHIVRSPDLILFSLLQPVMFIMLFTYVFGGAIDVGGDYAQFLLPGILVQMAIYGAAVGASIGISTDMHSGLIDRFRSMPMGRSAVLVGRTLSEVFRTVLVLAVTVGVGLLVGFRFLGGALPVIGGIALLLLFGYAISWLGAFIGVSVGSVQAAQAAGGVWIFPFTLISSAFVPTETMPGWLQTYAAYSPMTAAVNAVRALFSGAPAGSSLVQTLAWSVGLIAVLAPLTVRQFNRR